MAYLATAALFLTVATLFPIGGVILTPFVLGLFLLSLVGVLSDRTDRTVRQHDPPMDSRSWRSRA